MSVLESADIPGSKFPELGEVNPFSWFPWSLSFRGGPLNHSKKWNLRLKISVVFASDSGVPSPEDSSRQYIYTLYKYAYMLCINM